MTQSVFIGRCVSAHSHCLAWVSNGWLNTLAPSARAISTVASTLSESTTKISCVQGFTLSRQALRLRSSFLVIMTTVSDISLTSSSMRSHPSDEQSRFAGCVKTTVRRIRLGFNRKNSAVPTALDQSPQLFPGLKSWANLDGPSGTNRRRSGRLSPYGLKHKIPSCATVGESRWEMSKLQRSLWDQPSSNLQTFNLRRAH